MSKRILLLNGPNLNLLGTREPDVYGRETLADVVSLCERTAAEFGFTVRAIQSNHEGHLLDALHEAGRDCAGVVLNAGGFTHTSVALRDAVAAIAPPVVEVHVSNVYAREEFRHRSLLSAVCTGVIAGCGTAGYAFAVRRLAQLV